MECLAIKNLISFVSQNLAPGYLEYINSMDSRDCTKEITFLLKERCEQPNEPNDPLFSSLLLLVHRQTSLACQNNAALEEQLTVIRTHNASLLHEVQIANKKALRYLEDLHSAESNLCSYKEQLLKVRGERLPQALSTSVSSPQANNLAQCPLKPSEDGSDQMKIPSSHITLGNPLPNLPSYVSPFAVSSSPGLTQASLANISRDHWSKHDQHLSPVGKIHSSSHENGKGGFHFDSGYSDQQSSSCSEHVYPKPSCHQKAYKCTDDDSDSWSTSQEAGPMPKQSTYPEQDRYLANRVQEIHFASQKKNKIISFKDDQHHPKLSAHQPLHDVKPLSSREEIHLASPHKQGRTLFRDSSRFHVTSTSPSPQRYWDSNAMTSFSLQETEELHPTSHSFPQRKYEVSSSILPSKGGTKRPEIFLPPPIHQESEDCFSASASHLERGHRSYQLARDHANDHSVLPPPHRQTQEMSQHVRFKELQLIADDIERFDPDNRDHNVDDYLREIEYNLSDLPKATEQEKVRLIWKTSSRTVHTFVESQPSNIRNNFDKLCEALKEEYSPFADETSATIAAINIKQSRIEHPQKYYIRLRRAFFQGKNRPGLEENQFFKSLFIHNLHPCIRTHVALMTRQGQPSMHEIRKTTQMAWDVVVKPSNRKEQDKTIHLESIHSETYAVRPPGSHFTKDYPVHQNRTKRSGGRPPKDHNTKRHGPRRCDHRHRNRLQRPDQINLAHTESEREFLVSRTGALPDISADETQTVSDLTSISDCGYTELYSSKPRIKKTFQPKGYRGRFSCS